MRAPWIAGDFGAIAREIGAPEAEAFVARMRLEPGARVLDIACGTGNATIPLARRGARVTGLDMIPHLVRVPPGGVGAVGKWPVAATAKSQAATGDLSTAVVIVKLR